MKRLSVLTTIALSGAVFATFGCKPKVVDPMQLIPEGAVAVGGIDVSGVMATEMFKENKEAMLANADVKETMDAMTTCKLDPMVGTSLLIGLADEDKFTFSVKSKGIGTEANLKCMIDAIKSENADKAPELKDVNGKKALVLDGGEGTCYLASADLLACASKGWATDVATLLDGKGTSAANGSFKAALGGVDQSKGIWFSAQMTGELGEQTKGSPLEKAKSMSGSLDMTSGLAVALTADLGTPEDATGLADMVNGELAKVLPMAPMIGVPKPVADSVKVAAEGAAVKASMAATNEELKAISTALQQMGASLGG